jgi:hypothetical protein
MGLRTVRFFALFAVALTLGLTFAHVLEIPGKLRLGGDQWLIVQQNLYIGFGTVGAIIEIAGIILVWLLLFMSRHHRAAFYWVLVAASCVTAGLGVWFRLVSPMNAIVSGSMAASLPADWTAVRNQWEVGQAIHAALFALGFGFLLAAPPTDTPEREETPRRR